MSNTPEQSPAPAATPHASAWRRINAERARRRAEEDGRATWVAGIEAIEENKRAARAHYLATSPFSVSASNAHSPSATNYRQWED